MFNLISDSGIGVHIFDRDVRQVSMAIPDGKQGHDGSGKIGLGFRV